MEHIETEIHYGQFYIDRLGKCAFSNWRTVEIGTNWYLYIHHALRVHIGMVSNSVTVLLGEATEICLSNARPYDLVDEGSVERRDIDTWAGRWILIHDGIIETDSAALLSCYYTSGAARKPFITSSLSIASDLCEIPSRQRVAPLQGIDWVPAPLSALEEFRRLLPSQSIKLSDEGISVNYDRDGLLCPEATDTPVKDYAEALLHGLRSCDATGFHLALTGGLDSRTVLAALSKSGVNFATFTHVRSETPKSDCYIPPILSDIVGVPHFSLIDGKRNIEYLSDFDRHSFWQCAQCRAFYEYDHYRMLPYHSWTMLTGGCFEVGRCYLWGRLPDSLAGEPSEIAREVVNRFQPKLPQAVNNIIYEGLTRWISDVKNRNASYKIDWRDLFYVEQRLSGWLSTTEQATDFNGFRKLPIANSFYLYRIMLTQSIEDRITGRLQKEVIEYLNPSLLKAPINPPPSKYEQFIRKTRNVYLFARGYL